MRLLIVQFTSSSPTSGMGRWAACVASALSAAGHVPTLWSADDFPLVRGLGRLAALAFPLSFAARLWRQRASFDAVVVHEPSGFWYALLRRVARVGPPMTLICHNVESKVHRVMRAAAARGFAHPTPWNSLTVPLLRLWQSDGAIRLADRVVCLSTEDRAYIADRLGRRPEGTAWSPNGAAPEDVATQVPERQGARVLFVGGWLDIKGRRVLPGIWRTVRSRLPRAVLTAAGTGQAADRVLAEFAQEDRASVTVLPSVRDRAGMSALYRQHDVLLMPSLSEGSPLAVIEAMAAGLPVVAARVGGVPDLVTHGREGLLFPPMDGAAGAAAVERVLQSADLADALGVAGRVRARELTWSAVADALVGARQADTRRERAPA